MDSFRMGVAKLAVLAAVVTLATPANAALVTVSANSGHYLLFGNGEPSNQTVYTDQHSIENVTPLGGGPGSLVRRDNGVVTAGPASSATRFEVSASEPQAEAYAYGDLRTGKVGAYAGTGATGFASASAVISDTLTFNIAGAEAATITPLRFLISLHAATANANGVFQFTAGTGRVTTLGALNQPYYSDIGGWSQSSTWVENSTRYFDLTYNLQGVSPTFGVSMTLEAIAGLGEISDFYHTAGLQLHAPRGVTYTSQSGVFLTGGAVPEPATWAMMIVGFGAAGSMIRRKAVVA